MLRLSTILLSEQMDVAGFIALCLTHHTDPFWVIRLQRSAVPAARGKNHVDLVYFSGNEVAIFWQIELGGGATSVSAIGRSKFLEVKLTFWG